MSVNDRLHLRLRLLFRSIVPSLGEELLKPMPVNKHSNELLDAVKPLRLRHSNDISTRHRFHAIHPVGGDALADLVQEGLFFHQFLGVWTTRRHVCCANEQRGSSTDRVERHTVEDRFEDHEDFDDRHEDLDPTWRPSRLLPDSLVGDELVVHCDRFPDITVPHPDHRRSSKLDTCLFIPEVDAEKRPPPHFIFDRVEAVESFGISV